MSFGQLLILHRFMLFIELILEGGRCDQSLVIFLNIGILSRADNQQIVH